MNSFATESVDATVSGKATIPTMMATNVATESEYSQVGLAAEGLASTHVSGQNS